MNMTKFIGDMKSAIDDHANEHGFILFIFEVGKTSLASVMSSHLDKDEIADLCRQYLDQHTKNTIARMPPSLTSDRKQSPN